MGASAERIANHFVDYLFDTYRGSRHVRQVAAWVALIVLGIERLAGHQWRVPRDRQLRFEVNGRPFKGRYNHKLKPRGGVEIVEILSGRGSPEGRTVALITSLGQAETFYAARLRGDPWP